MNKRFLVLIVCIIVFVCGCSQQISIHSREKVMSLISNNAQNFEHIHAKGMISVAGHTVEWKGLFLLRKDSENIRVDLFSSGIFALRPSIMAQCVVSDSIYIINPAQKIYATMDRFFPSCVHFFPQNPTELFKKNGQWMTQYQDILCLYTETGKLQSIDMPDGTIDFIYYRHDFPAEIVFTDHSHIRTTLTIDTWNAEVTESMQILNIHKNDSFLRTSMQELFRLWGVNL